MKTYLQILTILFMLCNLLGCGNEEITPDYAFDLQNTTTNFEYEIKAVQKNGANSEHLFFVLDPTDLLPLVLEEFDALESNKKITFVGVYSKEENKRVRDYTPTANGDDGGMADEYYDFIKNEVVNELYAQQIADSSSQKGLIGHSIGGLSTSYAFCTHNNFFENYLVLSPAMFWDDFSFFEIEANLRPSIITSEATMYIGAGDAEDFSINNCFDQWTSILEEHYPNVNMNSEIVKGGHYGSRSEILSKGLKFILQ